MRIAYIYATVTAVICWSLRRFLITSWRCLWRYNFRSSKKHSFSSSKTSSRLEDKKLLWLFLIRIKEILIIILKPNNNLESWVTVITFTAWKVFKYRIFSGPYFPAFGLNTECRKIRTRKSSVFGHI